MSGCRPLLDVVPAVGSAPNSLAPDTTTTRLTSLPPVHAPSPRILIIEEDSDRHQVLRVAMEGEGYETRTLTVSDNLVELVTRYRPDAVLLGISPSADESYELCAELRSMDALRHVPVVLVAASSADDSQVARGLLAGADDFVSAGRPLELRARLAVRLRGKRDRDALKRVRSQRDVLLRQVALDPLTGIPNRRTVEEAVASRMSEKTAFGLLFLDIDHFKRVNDRYGHDAGDEVLQIIADYLKRVIRSGDTCGRMGGEEIVLVIAEIDSDAAMRIAERHRHAISRLRFQKCGAMGSVTVSIGVAVYDPSEPDLDAAGLFRRADLAMYEAKRLGRNQVVLAQPPQSTPPMSPSEPPVEQPMDSAVCDTTDQTPAARAPTGRPTREAVTDPVELELLRKLNGGRAALPVLPTAAAEALRLASDPDADVARLSALLDKDPHFAARFLSLANSPIYSRGIRTATMRDAIVRIGLGGSRDLLFQIVYAASTFGVPRYQHAVSRSYQRSVLSAVAVKIIMQAAKNHHAYGYLCGLLHDVGEARVYRILASQPQPPRDPDQVEQLVSRHHCRAGAELATAWRLPADIIEACSEHHADPPPEALHVRLSMAADALVAAAQNSADLPPSDELIALTSAVGMKPDHVEAARAELRQAAHNFGD